jgi:hypothetical protein
MSGRIISSGNPVLTAIFCACHEGMYFHLATDWIGTSHSRATSPAPPAIPTIPFVVNPIGDLLLVIEPLFHVDLYVTQLLNIIPRVEFLSGYF